MQACESWETRSVGPRMNEASMILETSAVLLAGSLDPAYVGGAFHRERTTALQPAVVSPSGT